MANERRLDRNVSQDRERFGRDYLSASYGSEIPPDNLEELLKNAEPDMEKERGRIVRPASSGSFKAQMEAVRSRRAQHSLDTL